MKIENSIYFLQAYQKWAKSHQISEKKLPGFSRYSAEQMFFIAFGQYRCAKLSDDYAIALYSNDDHSPNRFRYISVLIRNRG